MQPVVEVEPLRRWAAPRPGRLDPRPGDREPVAADAEPPHQRDVLGEAVVVVAGDRAGGAVGDPARLGGEGVPDAGALAVLGGRPLDLVRRGAGAEAEARWELGSGQAGGHGDNCAGDRRRSAGDPTGSSTRDQGRLHPPLVLVRVRTTTRSNVGFGPLVCHDDHLLGPGAGFDDHAHARRRDRDLGARRCAVAHRLDRAHRRGRGPGRCRCCRPASGIAHRGGRRHRRRADPVRPGLAAPRRGRRRAVVRRRLGDAARRPLVPVASGRPGAPRPGSAPPRRRSAVARLAAGRHRRAARRAAPHVFVARGALVRSCLAEPLADGDAFRITDRAGARASTAGGRRPSCSCWTLRPADRR